MLPAAGPAVAAAVVHTYHTNRAQAYELLQRQQQLESMLAEVRVGAQQTANSLLQYSSAPDAQRPEAQAV
jgi:hypothetical protein